MATNAFNFSAYSTSTPTLVPPLPPKQSSFDTFIKPHLSHLKSEVAAMVFQRLLPSAKALMSGQLNLCDEISLAIVSASSPASSPTRALYSSSSDRFSPSSSSSIFLPINIGSDSRSSISSETRSSLSSHRLSPTNLQWDRPSFDSGLSSSFSQEVDVDGEEISREDSESSVDEDDIQGTLLKALKTRLGPGGSKDKAMSHSAHGRIQGQPAQAKVKMNATATLPGEDLASSFSRLFNHTMNSKELLQLAANVTAPSFARPLPRKDKSVRFSPPGTNSDPPSLSLSPPRPPVTTLDECMAEALDRLLKENARLKEENEGLQDVIDRLGSWSDDQQDKEKVHVAEYEGDKGGRRTLIERMMCDDEADPSASFGSRFCMQEESEDLEEDIEDKAVKGEEGHELVPSAFDRFLNEAISLHIEEALFS